jgi:poly-beta-1,6-N-acetyl-D-glucosamine synthase
LGKLCVPSPTYVLISPARDEEAYIANLLESVAAQTIRPAAHVVVSDGSRDATDRIVRTYTAKYDFVRLLPLDHDRDRSAGSKASAIGMGYEQVRDLQADYVGCLDADVTLLPNYYESVLDRMESNRRLGIASGICLEKTGKGWRRDLSNRNHVPGAVQLFRRKCFEDIGGYLTVSVLGEDSLAEIRARMKGWQTRSFSDLTFFHHRPVGSATGSAMRNCFRLGQTDFHLGKHPLFVVLKAMRRTLARPVLFGALAHVIGYMRLWVARRPRDAGPEIVEFIRREDASQLSAILFHGKFPF